MIVTKLADMEEVSCKIGKLPHVTNIFKKSKELLCIYFVY